MNVLVCVIKKDDPFCVGKKTAHSKLSQQIKLFGKRLKLVDTVIRKTVGVVLSHFCSPRCQFNTTNHISSELELKLTAVKNNLFIF